MNRRNRGLYRAHWRTSEEIEPIGSVGVKNVALLISTTGVGWQRLDVEPANDARLAGLVLRLWFDAGAHTGASAAARRRIRSHSVRHRKFPVVNATQTT